MLVDNLKRVQATAFALTNKAQYYHWNVEGPDFAQYHEFLGDFYAEVYDSVDTLAELVRTLNAYAPGARRMILELSALEDDTSVPEALEMLRRLQFDNNVMLGILRECYREAEAASQIGISNFLQDRIQAHEKHDWMLRSFIK